MKEKKRDEIRVDLIKTWEHFLERTIYDDVPFSYDRCCKLIKKTKEYFDDLPVKGLMDMGDCRLYETVSALRYIPGWFVPEESDAEEFAKACKGVREMLESLETVSK